MLHHAHRNTASAKVLDTVGAFCSLIPYLIAGTLTGLIALGCLYEILSALGWDRRFSSWADVDWRVRTLVSVALVTPPFAGYLFWRRSRARARRLEDAELARRRAKWREPAGRPRAAGSAP